MTEGNEVEQGYETENNPNQRGIFPIMTKNETQRESLGALTC